MENYKIYEEIGRGSHSSVYKARRKHTITYVAVKSTAKSRMDKILNEVQLLHKLQSPHVVKFYNWYESQNHIWLILEYCIGGDLSSVLAQDKSLPEESVRFADFGFARPIPMEESDCSIKQLTAAYPNYMAPELSKAGIFSFASDFWALGCVLCELYTGQSTVVNLTSSDLASLRQVPIAGRTASTEFCGLLSGLLTEDPLQRMDWNALICHSFWKGFQQLKEIAMPEQKLFESHYCNRDTDSHARKDERDENNEQSRRSLKENTLVDSIKNSVQLEESVAQVNLGTSQRLSFKEPSTNASCVSNHSATSLQRRPSSTIKQLGNDTIDPATTRNSSQSKSSATKSTSKHVTNKVYSKSTRKVSSDHGTGHVYIHCGSSYLKRPSQLILSPQFDANLKPIAYFHIEYVAEVSTQIQDAASRISGLANLLLHMPTERHQVTENENINVYDPNELLQIPTEKLECHLRDIYQDLKEVQRTRNLHRKEMLLSYLLQLSFHARLANVLTNSSILIQLVRMLRTEYSSLEGSAWVVPTIVTGNEDRADTISYLCLVLAVLFRFATFISLSSHNEMQSFVKLLIQICLKTQENQALWPPGISFRTVALACLGEFLFLTATQNIDWSPVKEGFEVMWAKLSDCPNDVILCYYTAQTTCNILSHCQDRQILQQILSEELARCILEYLMHHASSNESREQSMTAKTNLAVRTVLTQTAVQVLRHIRFTSTLWTSPETYARKFTITATFMRCDSFLTIWRQLEIVHSIFHSPPDSFDEEVVYQCLRLVVAVLNSLNLLLELLANSESPLNNDKGSDNSHKRIDTDKLESTRVLLEEIVSFDVLLDIMTHIWTRYCNQNAVEKSDDISSLGRVSSAKFLIFIGLGIQSNPTFALRCIQANYIAQLEIYILPYGELLRKEAAAALIEHFSNQFDASIVIASLMDSARVESTSRKIVSQNDLSSSDRYLLQCALHLISITIRSALKQCSEWIWNLPQAFDEKILLEILHPLNDFLENQVCRIQMLCCYLFNSGKEGTIFLQLMTKLVEFTRRTEFIGRSSKPETIRSDEGTINQLSLGLSEFMERIENVDTAYSAPTSREFDPAIERLTTFCTQILEKILWTPTAQQKDIITPHCSWRHIRSQNTTQQ
uniref:Serine/threonine protein kinase putative n=1 Tax=Albugo laibachii Nc14 TaxID=890382 RepID=F0W1F6_9STRA|nr:serine/threonine protein kinase putative [Albugo laibachii Nc14]|eukprot:CCA14885.1 serine/threonine protein kinase putative [Albugo laibachii Nc14]